MLSSVSYFQKFFAFSCQSGCHPSACWNCHHKLGRRHNKSQFFCDSCHKIQYPTCDNYFELFEQPKSFNIDLPKLDKTYQQLQRKVHPDRFYSKSDKEKELSMQASGCINEGYKTLRSPIARGEYMLHLFGENVNTKVPQDFLMTVIDFHDQIEEATDADALKELYQQAQTLIKETLADLAKSLEVKDGKIANVDEAGVAISKLKYLSRINDTIKQKMPVQKL